MSLADKIWYEKSLSSFLLSLPLRPLSWLFAAVSRLRRVMYQSGICKSSAPPVPVLVVGGLSAGGSGKTPLCVALLKELQKRGYHPGLLSRGYHASCKTFPFRLQEDSSAELAGDEPVLIKRQSGAEVVIDPKRSRGADYLYSLGVDVIVTDDGLQHYALQRDVEICVLDGARMLGNGKLLPAGPLREGPWRLKTVDAVVINGAVAKIKYTAMVLHPRAPQPLNAEDVPLAKGSSVIALAGIGNPARFYKTLEDFGFTICGVIHAGDHEKVPVHKLEEAAKKAPVVMTAKDAIKYENLSLKGVYVLNVEAFLGKAFYDHIINLLHSARSRAERRKKLPQNP